jgi:putative ABC transport system permease protein
MHTVQQIATVTTLSIKSLPQRLGSSAIIVVSIAGVVAVLIGVLTLSGSLLRTMDGASKPDRAIVLAKGSRSEGGSTIQRSEVLTIEAAPGLGKTSDGKATASPELLAVVAARQQSDNARAEIVIRGVTPIAHAVRPEVKLIAGRMLQPGLHELLAGRAAAREYKGLALGDRVSIRGTKWTVVGTFESNGNVRESELMADAETLLSTFQRNTFQAVTVKLENAAAFDKFKDAITTDPSLSVDVLRESAYYSQQSEFLNKLLKTIAYIVGGIMAIGAMSGAVNCMYSAVSARGVEIATLRALGFNPVSVVVSVLAEALLLALIGAAFGAVIVGLILNGNSFTTQAGGGAIVAQLQIDSSLVTIGIVWACAIGFLGGLFPAIRVARLPVATALREV